MLNTLGIEEIQFIGSWSKPDFCFAIGVKDDWIGVGDSEGSVSVGCQWDERTCLISEQLASCKRIAGVVCLEEQR